MIENSIPVYYDEEFYKRTKYHLIDPERPAYTTKMFKLMKHYKFPDDDRVFWILANKSLTLNNIMFLEEAGWQIIGVENQIDEIRKCKKDFGFDQANIKLTIRKRE